MVNYLDVRRALDTFVDMNNGWLAVLAGLRQGCPPESYGPHSCQRCHQTFESHRPHVCADHYVAIL